MRPSWWRVARLRLPRKGGSVDLAPEVVKVKTKGSLDAQTGTSTSREMLIEIEGIESMKQEREILASLRVYLLQLSGQRTIDEK